MGRENLGGGGAFAPLLVDQNVWKSFQPTNISCGLKIIFMNEKVSKRFDSKFLEKVEVSGGNAMNEAKFCEEVMGEPWEGPSCLL